jgi:membrane protein YqaA with SNARE-associated domain
MSSEVVLGALAVSGATDVWLLLAVATAGNTLGAVVNWGIGLYASTWRTRLHWLEEAKLSGPAAGSIAGASGACCSAGCRSWEIR